MRKTLCLIPSITVLPQYRDSIRSVQVIYTFFLHVINIRVLFWSKRKEKWRYWHVIKQGSVEERFKTDCSTRAANVCNGFAIVNNRRGGASGSVLCEGHKLNQSAFCEVLWRLWPRTRLLLTGMYELVDCRWVVYLHSKAIFQRRVAQGKHLLNSLFSL